MAENDTVQAMIDKRYKLNVHCNTMGCHHRVTLDLKALRDRFGPNMSTMHDDLTPMLRCTKCGKNDVGLICTPPSRSSSR